MVQLELTTLQVQQDYGKLSEKGIPCHFVTRDSSWTTTSNIRKHLLTYVTEVLKGIWESHWWIA